MAPHDIISSLISAYPPRVHVRAAPTICGSMRTEGSGVRRTSFHVVSPETCWLHVDGRDEPMVLHAGDLVVFARNALDSICDAFLKGGCGEAARRAVSKACGYFEFDSGDNPIVAALPDVLVVRGDTPEARRLVRLIDLLVGETEETRGRESAVLDKLSEALFAMLVRHHLEHSPERRGFLAAITDPRLRRALAAFHAQPDRNWHVETLAAEAAMSRSSFAVLFNELVGMPPMRYLAAWRMRHGAHLLRDRRNSVRAVATRLGYRSEPAFRRAFERVIGRGPGEIRRLAAARGGAAAAS